MATEIATAYVSLVPSFRGGSRAISGAMAGPLAAAGTTSGRSLGSRMVSGMGRTLARGARVAGLAAGVAAGAAITTGLQSGLNQQRARATLEGLYGSASSATQLMVDIRDISRSSPIDYSAYLRAGEAFGYMGVNSKEVPGILENLGKAIVGVGGGSPEIDRASDALLKMVNNGRVYAADLTQLSDTGIPIIDALATHYNVTNEELKKMVTEGKVGVEDVIQVLKDADSPVFQQVIASGENVAKTLPAQFQILKGNVADTLGTMMQPAMGGLAQYLQRVNAWFTADNEAKAAAKVKKAMAGVRNVFAAAGAVLGNFRGPVVNAFNVVRNAITSAYESAREFFNSDIWGRIKLDTVQQFSRIWSTLKNTFSEVWDAVKGLLPSLGSLGSTFAVVAGSLGVSYWGILLRVINLLLPIVGTILVTALKALSGILSGVANWLSKNTWAVQALILAYTGWKIIGLIVSLGRMTIALATNTIGMIRNTAAAVAARIAKLRDLAVSGALMAMYVRDAVVKAASTAATVANTVATRAAAIGKGALNAVMVVSRGLWAAMTTRVLLNTAATAANRTAMIASAVATRGMAIAQRLLNAAMRANPIGIIITVLIAMGAAIVVLWKRSETFRNIVTGAWNLIKKAAIGAWNGFIKPALMGFWNALKTLWSVMVTVKNALVTAWNAVRAAFGAVWRWIRDNVIAAWNKAFSFLRRAFVAVKDGLVKAWNLVKQAFIFVWNLINKFVIQPWIRIFKLLWRGFIAVKNGLVKAWNLVKQAFIFVWNLINKFVIQPWIRIFRGLWRAFIAVKNGLVKAWNIVRDSFAAAWNWIRDKAINPLRRGFQWVWDKVVQVKNGVVNTFESMRKTVARIFNSLKSAVSKPIKAVIDWINKNLIGKLNVVTKKFGLTIPDIPGGSSSGGKPPPNPARRRNSRGVRSGAGHFNKGGVIPGGGPDKDNYPAMLTPGESVFTRKRTKELGGRGAVDAINRKGWGALGGASGADRHASGGWISDRISDLGTLTKNVFSGVGNTLQSGLGKAAWSALDNTVLPLMDSGLGHLTKFMPEMAGQFTYGVFQKLKGHIRDWLIGEDEQQAAAMMSGAFGKLGAGKYGGTRFNAQQMANASTIMEVGRKLGGSQRDVKIALMTAMQESTLRNLNYGDRDSLGLFQQRAAWGSAKDRTNPVKSTTMFFRGGRQGQRGLFDFKNRGKMGLGEAAQAVQVSAFPGAYSKWADEAQAMINAAKKAAQGGGPGGLVTSGRIMKRGTYRVGRGSAAHGYPSVDLPAPTGTPVYSPWAGRASRKSMTTSYGKHVRVTGSHGLTFLGAHLSRHAGGGRVSQGQIIGRVGSTGNSTGPHLHAEVLRGGRRLEPSRYLKYDQGGYLPTGHSLVYNGTGGPERVLDRRETEKYDKGRGDVQINTYGTPKQLVNDVAFALRHREMATMTSGV